MSDDLVVPAFGIGAVIGAFIVLLVAIMIAQDAEDLYHDDVCFVEFQHAPASVDSLEIVTRRPYCAERIF